MDNTFKKLTEEIKKQVLEKLNSPEIRSVIEKTSKANPDDTGKFKIVISTADEDRQGEVIDQNGWDLEPYKANPVVLWAHDYNSLPIGVTHSIEKDKDGNLVAEGMFAPEEANPFAQQVRKLYDLGFVRAASVGFIPREMTANVISKAELLEWSFVPVPANRFALSNLSQRGLDIEALMTKGLVVKQEPGEGEDGKDEELTAAIGGHLSQLRTDVDSAIATHAQEILELVKEESGEKASAQKAGRVLSEKNRLHIKNAVSRMKEAIVALEELLEATEPQGGEAGIGPNGPAETKGRDPLGFDEKSLEEWLAVRQVLKSINTITSEKLAEIREKIREKSPRK